MAVTSYHFPATVNSWDHDSDGTGSTTWTNPSNGTADDNNDVTRFYNNAVPIGTVGLLQALDFGFTTSDIPSSSTIDGIELACESLVVSGTFTFKDNLIQMVVGGALAGTNQSTGLLIVPTTSTRTVYTIGGATNLLGTTITDSQARNSTTGWALDMVSVGAVMGSGTIGIDYMKMRYYYSATGGGPTVRKKPIFIMRYGTGASKLLDNKFEDYLEEIISLRRVA